MTQYDLRIRNGTIVDGTRVPRFRGDLWVKDGRIARIGGRAQGPAAREIDAEGLIVAPGFVDLHTHYDAQIQWDPYCTISGWHGVTSVVLGNCGFGFAPVPPEGRDRAMLTMSRTEAIPFDSMKAGMLWDWVTFPEWLKSLERMPKGVNCLTYMPVAPLMTWVMGLAAAKSRPATRQEQAEMKALLHEAMDAGACGFSLQRLGEHSVQADFDGTPMVTDTMCDEDVLALAEVLAERDEGFIQITQFTGDLGKDLAFQEKLAEVSGRPILHNVVAVAPRKPEVHRDRLQWLDDANEKGLRIFGQAFTMRTGFAFTLEHWNLLRLEPGMEPRHDRHVRGKDGEDAGRGNPHGHPRRDRRGHREARPHPGSRRTDRGTPDPVRRYLRERRGPRVPRRQDRRATRGGDRQAPHRHDAGPRRGGRPQGRVPRPRPRAERRVHRRDDHGAVLDSRRVRRRRPHQVLHRRRLHDGLPGLDGARRGQGVARGSALSPEFLPAFAAGFRDRGFLREGAPADIVVYDLDALEVTPRWVGDIAHDFPANEWRRVQRAKGYRAILVNGEPTFENGECTGRTPGRLLRHGQA